MVAKIFGSSRCASVSASRSPAASAPARRLPHLGRRCDFIQYDPARPLGRSASGAVALEPRRGNHHSIVETTSPKLACLPERLIMDEGEGAFMPENRIGQLATRGMDSQDSRARFEIYSRTSLQGRAAADRLSRLVPGENDAPSRGAEP